MPSNTRDSPPPPPPETLSPGIRATALQRNLDQALAHTLRSCSYTNFATCFPTPAEHVPEALSGLHREFVGKLEQVCKTEFKALIHDRNVITSLNELDGLINDAGNRMAHSNLSDIDSAKNMAPLPPNPPHLLPPPSLLGAHMAQFLSSQNTALSSELEKTQLDNRELALEIASQKSTIETLLVSLENVILDLDLAARSLAEDQLTGVDTELQDAAKSPPMV